MLRLLCSLVLLALTATAFADADDFLPGSRYADDAPRFEDVLGYSAGERISSPEQVRAWFEALAEAWPDRVRLVPYATSWEGRELFYAIIGTPERIADLDAVRADIRAIAFPDEHDEDRIEAALERVPGTTWIAGSVHGNEISPADGAMVTAWHLLAAVDDPVVDEILAETLVFINPLQNPDGRARFVHGFRQALGLEPAATRLAAEHDEPWPSGRVNHYLFDLNRDWLAITQPETQGHVAALLEWFPLAFVDAHEMGSDSTFFFAPEAVPYNPLLAGAQRENLELFGRNNARWFDRFGFPYFTREVYDAFYPGYGASWPSYYGGVAMTYEQGSARGLVMRLRDGTEMTYAETVREYFVAMLATAQTVARNRDDLWRDFRDYRAAGIELARREGPRAWVIPAQRDQGGADHLAATLARHGIDAYRASEPLTACGRDLAPGSVVIPAEQPDYRKLRVLLDADVPLPDDFVAEQERRRARDLDDEIYDVTAWSLPLMFNIDVAECRREVSVDGMTRVAAGAVPPGSVSGPEDAVAWLAPGGSRATTRLLAGALRGGLSVQSSEEAFTHEGREYPRGTLIVPASGNGEDVVSRLQALAEETGAEVVGAGESWVTAGPDFGSRSAPRIVAPRIALAWDTPTDIYAPGATRFVIEREIGYPVIPIRTSTLKDADLNRFDVLILPDASERFGGYSEILGDEGRDHLADWVDGGGVLVTMAGATEWASHPDVDLLAIRAEHQVRDEDEEEVESKEGDSGPDEDAPVAGRVPGIRIESAAEFQRVVQPERENPDPVAGVLVRAESDPDHWLTAGVAGSVQVLVRGDRVFRPMPREAGRDVVRFAGPEDLLAAGLLWDENRAQLAYKPFVVHQPRGRGMVIGFTEDPTVRAYLDGLNTLLANAVLRAPTYSERLR